jgi:hypothetical protein
LAGFPNPYLEKREKSKGERVQEWAGHANSASSILGISLTETEKRAVAVVIGAFVREWKKITWVKAIKFAAHMVKKK